MRRGSHIDTLGKYTDDRRAQSDRCYSRSSNAIAAAGAFGLKPLIM